MEKMPCFAMEKELDDFSVAYWTGKFMIAYKA